MTKKYKRLVRGSLGAVVLVVAGMTSLGARTPQATAPAGGQGREGRGGPAPTNTNMLMTSPAWEDGGVIPDRYTGKAGPAVVSPELKWAEAPAGTQSFVLLFHDPEPVIEKNSEMDVTHWLIWNIPGTSKGLPEGVAQGTLPDGSRQVSMRTQGYMGPGAPPGPYHHYTFELFALDTMLTVPQGTPQDSWATRMAVFNAMNGHVLGKALLVARFHR